MDLLDKSVKSRPAVTAQCGVNREQQNIVACKTGIERRQILQASHEKPGTNQQHERQKHLSHHEELAGAKSPGASGTACLECWGEIDPRSSQGGSYAKKNSDNQAKSRGERQHPCVEIRLNALDMNDESQSHISGPNSSNK